MLRSLARYRDLALLLARLLFGLTFIFAHGGPKVMSPDTQVRVGQAMEMFGITFGHRVWGLMAGMTETTVGVLFIIGFAVRPAAIGALGIMFVAVPYLMSTTGRVFGATPAIDATAGYIALLAFGAGRYSLDYMLGFDRPDESTAAKVTRARASA